MEGGKAHAIGHGILSIIRGEEDDKHDDDAEGVHQAGLDDDVHGAA